MSQCLQIWSASSDAESGDALVEVEAPALPSRSSVSL